MFNASEMVASAALAGHGLAWLPRDAVQAHLDSGSLVSVLDEWAAVFSGYHAYYASRRVSPAVKLVLDALRGESAP